MSRRDGVRPKTDMSPSAPLGSQARGEVAKREVWTDGGRDWVGVLPGPPARVGGRLVLCPTPGRAPRPCLRGAGPGPMLAAPMRGGREKDRGKPALNEAHRAAPHSAEGTQRHSMRNRGVTHVPGVRGPPSLHPHHPGALWPPPWRARASPAQTLQTSGQASRLGSCHRWCVWNQLGLGTGDPSLGTLTGLANTPFQPASRAGFLMWGPQWACPCYVKSTCAGRSHTKSLKTHRPQGDFKASKKCQGLRLCCPFLPQGEGRPWVLLPNPTAQIAR